MAVIDDQQKHLKENYALYDSDDTDVDALYNSDDNDGDDVTANDDNDGNVSFSISVPHQK